MKKQLRNVSIILAVLILAGCKLNPKSTTTGNPFVSFIATGSSSVATVAKNIWDHIFNQLVPRAQAFPPPNMMSDSAGNTVTINTYWYTIGEIEFKLDEVAGSGEVDGDSIEFHGPYSVDLFAATPSVVVGGYIGANQIRRVKTKLVKTIILPSAAPAALANKSLYFSGTINGHNVTYSTQEESKMEVAGPNVVNAVDNSVLLLELLTANLIKRIDFTAISADTDINENNRVPATNPCPNIDASATDLYTCLRKGIETESNFGRDEDGDHQLDLNEEAVD